VMGRAVGILRERDRRCGMAGTMRERGRRACLCAAGAISATIGAMLLVVLVVVVINGRLEWKNLGGLRQRLQVSAASGPCQLSWSALRRGVQQRQEGGGMSEGKRAAAMETSDRLAAYCGDEAMTHVRVSQHYGLPRRPVVS
jgi:hypothetical protein